MTQLLDENTRSIETDETGWSNLADVWLFYAQIPASGAAYEGDGYLVVIPEDAVTAAAVISTSSYSIAGGSSFTAVMHAKYARLSVGNMYVTLYVYEFAGASVVEVNTSGPQLLVTAGSSWETVNISGTINPAADNIRVVLGVSSDTAFVNDHVFFADAVQFDVIEVNSGATPEATIGFFGWGGLHPACSESLTMQQRTFESPTDPIDWVTFFATLARDTAQAHSGSASVLWTQTGTSSFASIGTALPYTTITPGNVYEGSGWIRVDSATAAASAEIWATVAFYNSSHGFISETQGTHQVGATADVWHEVTVSETVTPVGAAYARLTLTAYNGGPSWPAGAKIWFDDTSFCA